MKKRILSMLMVLVTSVSLLAGCGGSTTEQTTPSGDLSHPSSFPSPTFPLECTPTGL